MPHASSTNCTESASRRPGISGCVEDVYARKFTAGYAAEMNRSVAWWLERWIGVREPPPSSRAAHQPHVPEATHHAGTANVTSAMTATSATAVPRLVIQLLMVTGSSFHRRPVTGVYPAACLSLSGAHVRGVSRRIAG